MTLLWCRPSRITVMLKYTWNIHSNISNYIAEDLIHSCKTVPMNVTTLLTLTMSLETLFIGAQLSNVSGTRSILTKLRRQLHCSKRGPPGHFHTTTLKNVIYILILYTYVGLHLPVITSFYFSDQSVWFSPLLYARHMLFHLFIWNKYSQVHTCVQQPIYNQRL